MSWTNIIKVTNITFQLELDFKKIIAQKVDSNIISSFLASEYNTIFSNSWSNIAAKLIVHFRKSKVKEIRDFYSENASIIAESMLNILYI